MLRLSTLLAFASSTLVAGTALAADPVDRTVVTGDVAHYTFDLKVGDGPNAHLKIHRVVRERAPGVPRSSGHAVMLLHGDFATFSTNFMAGLAPYLAQKGVDVWGVDRRWTYAPAGASDTSDFPAMTLASDIDDTEIALGFARAARALTGSGGERIMLGGFSHGAQLTYEVAAAESQRPMRERQIRAIVPIDIYARIAPDDEALRQTACANRDGERALVAEGMYDSDNSFFIVLGSLDQTAPLDASPFFDGYTNRMALQTVMGQTYFFYAPTPVYHLAAAFFDASGSPTSFRYSSEEAIDDWLVAAPQHHSMPESADLDAMWCGEGPLPVGDHVADIKVPLYYLGAAGGFGDHGLYTTRIVASTDVTTRVVRRLDAASEAEDYGHGDLLYAADAPALAWQPMADWMLQH